MAKKKAKQKLDLVGLAEVAEMLGIRRGSVASRRQTHFDTFPAPIAQLACGPIWHRSDVTEYLALEERLGQRDAWVRESYPGALPPWRQSSPFSRTP